MADEESEEKAPIPGDGKMKMIIIIMVSNVVLIGGGGVGLYFALSGQSAEAAEPAEEPDVLGPLLEMDPLVVNLNENDGTHYLRASFRFEIADAEEQSSVEERLVPIRSAVLLHLSSLGLEETTGQEARESILEQVRDIANEAIGAERVRRVYVTEFVVQ